MILFKVFDFKLGLHKGYFRQKFSMPNQIYFGKHLKKPKGNPRETPRTLLEKK